MSSACAPGVSLKTSQQASAPPQQRPHPAQPQVTGAPGTDPQARTGQESCCPQTAFSQRAPRSRACAKLRVNARLGSGRSQRGERAPELPFLRQAAQETPPGQAGPAAVTLGKCFMTHITTGCRDGIFTREKLFSRRSSSFLYLERLTALREQPRTKSEAAPCLSPDRWVMCTGDPFFSRDV